MSLYQPERLDARGINLASRIVSSNSIVGSPAAASETIIASLTLPQNVQVYNSVDLVGWAAYTLGTNGVSAQLKLRQTNASGQTIADTGATTGTAANLYEHDILGANYLSDTNPPLQGMTYVLTLTVASGSAISTVSAVYLRAIIV